MADEEVKQIWAEAVVIYNSGEKLYLEGTDAMTATSEQDAAMETDEREGLVREYLDTLLPKDWDEMSLYERRNYLHTDDFGDKPVGTVARKYVCNLEIWCEAFGKDGASIKPADSYAIAAIMRKIGGWEKADRKTYHIYGSQRGYMKL